MRYCGHDFNEYLAAFKEFFDIPTNRKATDKIAEIMQLQIPVRRRSLEELDGRKVFARSPVVVQEEGDGDTRQSGWDGGVVNL